MNETVLKVGRTLPRPVKRLLKYGYSWKGSWFLPPELWRLRLSAPLWKLVNRHYSRSVEVAQLKGSLAGFKMYVPLRMPQYRRYISGEWEPEVTNGIKEFAAVGASVVDVGAHLGYTALLMSKSVGPEGAVIAFEPSPTNIGLLRRTLELNGIHNVRTEQSVLSDRSGTVDLFLDTKSFSLVSSLVRSRAISLPRKTAVHSYSLDSYLQSKGLGAPSLVKIDVEGGEGLVLAGMVETLRAARPTVLIEFHIDDKWFVGTTALLAWETLARSNYKMFALTSEGKAGVRINELPGHVGRIQAVAIADKTDSANLRRDTGA